MDRREVLAAGIATAAASLIPANPSHAEDLGMDTDNWRERVEGHRKALAGAYTVDVRQRIKNDFEVAARMSDGLTNSARVGMRGITAELATMLGVAYSHEGDVSAADVFYRQSAGYTAVHDGLYPLRISLDSWALCRGAWEGMRHGQVVGRADRVTLNAREPLPRLNAYAALAHSYGEADDPDAAPNAFASIIAMRRAADESGDSIHHMRALHADLYVTARFGNQAMADAIYAELRPLCADRATTAASVEVEYATAMVRAGYPKEGIDRAHEALKWVGEPVMVLRKETAYLVDTVKRNFKQYTSGRLSALEMRLKIQAMPA